MVSELEPNLWDNVHRGRKRLFNFNAGKTEVVPFYDSAKCGGIDAKMDGSVLDEKSFVAMLGLSFSSKLYLDSTLPLLLKQSLRKLELWVVV